MDKPYKGRFQKFSESLSDPELINYARQIGKNTFSRKRKMPLKDMLLCCLSKKGLTTAFELRNYFKEKRRLFDAVVHTGLFTTEKAFESRDLSISEP